MPLNKCIFNNNKTKQSYDHNYEDKRLHPY